MKNAMTNVREKSSVTWNWLTSILVVLLFSAGGYVIASMDRKFETSEHRFEVLERRVDNLPTREEVRQLRVSIDKLSDKLDKFQVQVLKGH